MEQKQPKKKKKKRGFTFPSESMEPKTGRLL